DELRTAWGNLDPAKQETLKQSYRASREGYLKRTGESAENAAKQATEEAEGLAKGNYIAHVIEPSAGGARTLLALLCQAFDEEEVTDEKGKKEVRTVMRFHPRVAPIKVGIFPLLKNKPDLVAKALAVRDLLRPHMHVFYDDGGAIGRRYRRQD